MSIYVVSDVHAHYTELINNIPNDATRIILDGDMFNKGIENRYMLTWVIKNVDNKKIIHVAGNHEILTISQVKNYFISSSYKNYFKGDKFDIIDGVYKYIVSYERSNNMMNSSKQLILLLNAGVISFDEFRQWVENLKFYHVENYNKTDWYISHAAWVPFKNDVYSIKDLVNIMYDKDNYFLKSVSGKNYDEKIIKYTEWCIENNRKHVFGHWPTRIAFNSNPPVVIDNVYFYIDANTPLTKKVFFFKLF